MADTSVKWISSEMPGAPVLNGLAGTALSVLDALLTTGWGVQQATSLVVGNGVATATFPSNHAALEHSVILVSGVTDKVVLNGEQRVTAVASNQVKFATTASDGSAAGTITVKMAGASWEKPFAGTNVAVYRSTDPQSPRHFLRVQDSTGRDLRVRGYVNMTTADAGTEPFPTVAQVSGTGGVWVKSLQASNDAVRYLMVADSRGVWFFAAPYMGYGATYTAYLSAAAGYFGDPIAASPQGDPWATTLLADYSNYWEGYGGAYLFSNSAQSVYQPRAYTGTGAAVLLSVGHESGVLVGAMPDVIAGKATWTPVNATVYAPAGQYVPRSRLPGVLLGCFHNFASVMSGFQPFNIGLGAQERRYMHLMIANGYGTTAAANERPLAVSIAERWR